MPLCVCSMMTLPEKWRRVSPLCTLCTLRSTSKWQSFSRRNSISLYSRMKTTVNCLYSRFWTHEVISSANDFVPNRWQTIICTNSDTIRLYASELFKRPFCNVIAKTSYKTWRWIFLRRDSLTDGLSLNWYFYTKGFPPNLYRIDYKRVRINIDCYRINYYWIYIFLPVALRASLIWNRFNIEHINSWKMIFWCYIYNYQLHIKLTYLEHSLKLPLGKFHKTSLVTCQHWCRYRLGAVRQQASPVPMLP